MLWLVFSRNFQVSNVVPAMGERVFLSMKTWKASGTTGKTKRWGTDPKASPTHSRQFSYLALSSLSQPKGFPEAPTSGDAADVNAADVTWWEVCGWSGNAETNDQWYTHIITYALRIMDLNWTHVLYLSLFLEYALKLFNSIIDWWKGSWKLGRSCVSWVE